MTYEDKYKMSVDENIFYAKGNIVDIIWKEASLEGLSVNFPDSLAIRAIYEGINIPSLTVRDIIVINNLKHSWQFLLDTINYPLTISYINQMNQKIGCSGEVRNAGSMRTMPVKLGGTSWRPDIPDPETVSADITSILNIKPPTERAMRMMLYLMRAQLYNDGNKRTAQLVGNKIMIENGCGILSIPRECICDFSKLLIEFYETNNYEKIMDYVYDNCITRKDSPPAKESKNDIKLRQIKAYEYDREKHGDIIDVKILRRQCEQSPYWLGHNSCRKSCSECEFCILTVQY